MCDLFSAGVQTQAVQQALDAGEQDALAQRKPKFEESCGAVERAYRHAYGTAAFHQAKARLLQTAVVFQ